MARCDSRSCQVDARLRPLVEGAGPFSSTSLLQLAAVERLARAMNGVWNLGPQKRFPISVQAVARLV